MNLQEIRQKIMPTLQEVEQVRIEQLQAVNNTNKFYLLTLLPLSIGIFAATAGMIPGLIISAVIAIMIVAAVYYSQSQKKKVFTQAFKHKVMKSFVQSIYPAAKFAPNQKVSSSLFKQSTLFSGYSTYRGEDYFIGQTENGQNFEFSELNVTSTSSDGDGGSKTTTVFKGIFFVLDAPFSLGTNEQIRVLPDSAEKSLGKLGKFFQSKLGGLFSGAKMVYMEEHPEFEEDYVVYAKDKEAAYKILTPNMIGAIYNLKYSWKKTARISFIGDKIFIACNRNTNFFETSIQTSVLGQHSLNKLYNELSLCFTLLEDFSTLKPDENHQPKDENWQNSAYKHLIDNSGGNNPFLL